MAFVGWGAAWPVPKLATPATMEGGRVHDSGDTKQFPSLQRTSEFPKGATMFTVGEQMGTPLDILLSFSSIPLCLIVQHL